MKKILYLLIFFGLLSIVWADSWKYGQCVYDGSSYVSPEDVIVESRNYTLQDHLFDTKSSGRLVCKSVKDAWYQIKYHSNDGTGRTQQSVQLPYGVSFSLPNNVFTRDGYTFSNWKDDKGQIYSSSITGKCGSQGCLINLYAQWATNSYNITKHFMDGITPNERVKALNASELGTPSRNGYNFVGWYYGTESSNTTINLNNFTNPNGTYSWTKDSNGIWSSGNSWHESTTSDMVSEEFTLNQNGTLSFEWKMDNASLYDYLGYDIYNVTNNSYLSGNSVPDYTNCLENLHRKSTAANYTTVTYNLPAGTYKVLFMYGKDGSIDDQNTGVTDKGYVKNIQVTGASGFNYTSKAGEFTRDCDVYAKWEEIPAKNVVYNVVYESSNHISLGSSTISGSNGSTTTVYAPSKTGYNTPSSQSVTFNSSSANKTITFTYTPISYNISYTLNGGSLSGQKTSYTIETANYTLPTPTKTGYTFTGWTGSNGSTAQTSVTISKGSTGDKSYTANWQENSAETVIYDVICQSSSGIVLDRSTISGSNGSTTTVDAPFKTGYSTPSSQNVTFNSSSTNKKITFTYTPIEYSINWNLDGGWLSGQKTSYNIETADYTLPAPNKTGNTFEGWYTDSGLTVTSIPKGSTGDKTFHARWKYVLTYILYDGRNFVQKIPNGTTSIVFTDEVAPSKADLKDVSKVGDQSVVGWLDDTTFKVSTQKPGQKVIFNKDSSWMFSGGPNGGNSVTRNLESIDFGNADTSKVTNMSRMFEEVGSNITTTFSLDLSGMDTSQVTNMSYMFAQTGWHAKTFSLDLSGLDVSNVFDMSWMFYCVGNDATTFSVEGLSNWDTSNVTDMSFMFESFGYKAPTVNLNLSNWNTSNVTTMRCTFGGVGRYAENVSLDLSGWNTSKVTDMSAMFKTAGEYIKSGSWSIAGLSKWDTSNVTDMSQMFWSAGQNATTWSIGDISNWNTSNVTNMETMFLYAGANATSFVLDLSKWDTSKATDMESMFQGAGQNATTWSIGNISKWVTSNVTNMSYMFLDAGWNAEYSLNLSGWNVNKVTSHTDFNKNVTRKVIAPTWVN